jgi:hypothetical protein
MECRDSANQIEGFMLLKPICLIGVLICCKYNTIVRLNLIFLLKNVNSHNQSIQSSSHRAEPAQLCQSIA